MRVYSLSLLFKPTLTKKGCGKDAFADYLVKVKNFKKLQFGAKIKDLASERFSLDRKYFEERNLKDTILPNLGKTPRDLLIEIAAEKRREDEYYWIKQVEHHLNFNENFVISDVRFFKEVEFIKKKYPHALLIWINRPNLENVKDNSQFGKDYCDIIIENDQYPFNGDYLYQQIKFE